MKKLIHIPPYKVANLDIKISKNKSNNKTISFRLSGDLLNKLNELSKKENTNIGIYSKSVLVAFLERYDKF